MIHRLVAATLLLAGATAAAAEGKSFYGHAHDLETGKYLYTEVHTPVIEGGREVASTIRYYAPDGSLLGTKPLDYRGDRYVPMFRLELPKKGYVEAITANGATIEMKSSFMRPAQHQLRAVAKLLHKTATLAFCEASVFDDEGKLCATATGTFKYLRGLVKRPATNPLTTPLTTPQEGTAP